MNYLSIEDIIVPLRFFIDTHPTFKGAVVDSILDVYEDIGQITEPQFNVLLNIYYTWKVQEYYDKKRRGSLE